MARPRTTDPRLCWHKAAGQYYVTIPGQKQRLLGPDRAAAERERRRLVAEWLLGQNHEITGSRDFGRNGWPPVAVALERYLHHAETYYRDPRRRQLDRIGEGVVALLAVTLGVDTSGVTPRVLKAARTWLLSRPGKHGRPLSRGYVNSIVGTLQTCWRWLVSEDLAPGGSDVALRSVEALRSGHGGRETPPVLPAPPDAVQAILARLPPILASLVRVQQYTGCRPGEACALRPCDLSRGPDQVLQVPVGDGKTVPVSAVEAGGVLVWVYVPRQHKTAWRGKPRVVAIGPAAQAVLAPLLDSAAPDARLFAPYSTNSYAQAVRRACDRAGVPRFSPNRLRHSAATDAANSHDREHAAALLGHANPATTRIYVLHQLHKAAAVAAARG